MHGFSVNIIIAMIADVKMKLGLGFKIRLTSLFGTWMTFTICIPSIWRWTLSSCSAGFDDGLLMGERHIVVIDAVRIGTVPTVV